MQFATLNKVKQEAHAVLMHETFAQIHQQASEDFLGLARENARIRNVQASFFMYNGEVFPKETVNGTLVTNKVHVVAPPLHYSLMEQFDAIIKRINLSGKNEISNLFTAVLNVSYNGIVLEALLPTVLVNSLRQAFDQEDFFIINNGRLQRGPVEEPIEITQQSIQTIQKHYGATIEALRDLLMSKLLLSR